MNKQNFGSKLLKIGKSIVEFLVKSKHIDAISMPHLYDRIWSAIMSSEEFMWLVDVFVDDDNSNKLFAIFAKEGLLYRSEIIVENDLVSIGELVRVASVFKPSENTFFINKMAEEGIRWFLISSSSVLARSAVINSRQLFDNLVKRCNETGKYPYLTFFHLGNQFKMGITDWVSRSDNVLIASGLFDKNNSIADAMIVSYSREPEYWGSSISYWALEENRVEIIPGLKIPVYTDGEFEEISILPEKDANCLFTSLKFDQRKVNVMDKNIIDALMKLAGGNEELIKEFVSKVDSINENILEKNLITHSEPAKEPVVLANVELALIEPEPVEPKSDIIEIDEETISIIAEKIHSSEQFKSFMTTVDTKISEIKEIVKTFEKTVAEQVAAHTFAVKELKDKIGQLEKSDEEKQKQWSSDLPRNVKNVVTFRPKVDRTVSGKGEETSEKIAEDTLSKIK